MTTAPDLAALIGSRICHDLISPIGAIGNGVELVMMDGAGGGPEIALIAESVTNANARIRFFRVAFGSATADQRIGMPEVTSILSDLTRGTRLSVAWRATGDQPRDGVKLAFLGLQCLETALPWGGQVTIDRTGTTWRLAATARRLRIDPPLWDGLRQGIVAPDITAAQVHFALFTTEANRQGRAATCMATETTIDLSV